MIFFAVLLLVASVYGQGGPPPHCLHSNLDLETADNVIAKVLVDLDTDGNREISTLELTTEILGKFDANKDSAISYDEFVNKWHSMYKDVHDFAGYLFCHFDSNGDEQLELLDVPGLQAKADIDVNGKVSDVEFTIYMTKLYRDCEPHPHSTSGHCAY